MIKYLDEKHRNTFVEISVLNGIYHKFIDTRWLFEKEEVKTDSKRSHSIWDFVK